MKKNRFVLLLIFVVAFMSCSKHEGEGGTSTIKGTVIVTLVSDDFQRVYAIFPEEEAEVYIVYGDDEFYGDNIETQYDGTFQFQYLRKGKYQVFAYSDDETGQSISGKKPVFKNVEITKNGQNLIVTPIEIYNQVSNYEGSSTITGKLFALDYNAEMTILKDSFYVKDEYVYIAREGDGYYFERIKTYYDGSFTFPALPQGKYEIYAYGRDFTGHDPQDLVPYIVYDSITANKQTVDVGRIRIIN